MRASLLARLLYSDAMIGRALKNTGWLMSARTIHAVLSLVYLALATRALGLEGFGQLVLIFSFTQMLVGFTSFQTWQSIIRWGQKGGQRGRAVGFALALDVVTILGGTLIAGLFLAFAGDWFPIPQELRGMTFAFTVVYLLSIRSTPLGILRLHDRYARAAIADATTSIVRAIGAGLAAIWAPSIGAFLVVWGVAEVITAIMHWRMAAKTQPIAWRKISLTRLPREEKRVWSFVAGTSLTGTLTFVSRQLFVLLIGAFGGAALAGIYRVAAQIGEGVLKLAQALLKAVYPELVREPRQAANIVRKMTRIALVTGLAAITVSLLAGEWLIVLIAGPEFEASYWPLILLAAASALELAGASIEALIVARGKAITNFLLRLVPTAAALAALPWLLVEMGATGAALAVLVASFLSVIGFVVVALRSKPEEQETQ